LGFSEIEKFIEFITLSSRIKSIFFIKRIEGILSGDKEFLMNKESFKIYQDHPWMTTNLETYKLLVSKNAV